MRALVIHAALWLMVWATSVHGQIDHLRIDRARHERLVERIGLTGSGRAGIDAVFEQYQERFDSLMVTLGELNEWIQGQDLSHFGHGYEPELAKQIAEDWRRIDRNAWELARDIESWYFVRAIKVLPADADEIEAQRRAQLRDRVLGTKTPWRDQPVGVNVDLIALVDRTVPAERRTDELSVILDHYDLRLDPMLKQLETAAQSYRDEIRRAFDEARRARDDGSPQLPRLLDRIVAIMVRRHEQYPAIRALNLQTANQITANLSADDAEPFRIASDRLLHSYLYDHEWAADVRFKAAELQRNLDENQRESLAALQETHRNSRRAEIARISVVYDRTISVKHYRRDYELFVHRWATREHVPDRSADEIEFETALTAWRDREREFCRQIANLTGQSIQFEDVIDLFGLDREISEIPESLTQLYEETFVPDVRLKDLESFLLSAPLNSPEQEQSLRCAFAEMQLQYASRASEVRARLQQVHRRTTVYESLHPESIADPPSSRPDLGWEDLWTGWTHDREQIEFAFDSTIRAKLTADQQPVWDDLMRDVRRTREFGSAQRHNGPLRYMIDLSRILRDSGIDIDDQTAASAVDAYELEIDLHWRKYAEIRNEVNRVRDLYEDASGTASEDQARQTFLASAQSSWQAMVEIDATTQRHVNSIAATLGDARRQRFLDAVDQAVFPQLSHPDPVALTAAAIRDFDLIDAHRFEVILNIANQHNSGDAVLKDDLIRKTRQWEDPRQVEIRETLRQDLREAGEDGMLARQGHPAAGTIRARRHRAMQACRQIRQLFSEDEFDQLPPHLQLLLSWW